MSYEKKIKKVLIANRGEIAVRVARTLREMGIMPVAIYSEVDRIAPHVRVADMAYLVGPAPAPESYLRADKIIEVAKDAGVDAIHPGYGFLAENADFADAVTKAGIIFIGPSAESMRLMGNKTAAREAMIAAGVPVVPGSDGAIETEEEALAFAKKIGFPILLKAAAGGGGKGMRLVEKESELFKAFKGARNEARNAFGDDTVYIEKAIIDPRHIEMQILGGPDGKSIWMGERECSMQRRHQKVIEETPSPAVNEELRKRMGEVAVKAADAVDYVGAGTIEFLLDQKGEFYFLEMNTRLQVEHPVTELCCGIDLVEAQVRIAAGEPMPWGQDDIKRTGHAIEARIYAEDPFKGFIPSPGLIEDLLMPSGPGVRVDAGVATGFEVPRFYDPMIAKIAVWGEDRERARRRLHRALGETAVKGITTNTSFLRRLLELESFIEGDYHTGTVHEALDAGLAEPSEQDLDIAVAASVINAFRRDTRRTSQVASRNESSGANGWRMGGWRVGGG